MDDWARYESSVTIQDRQATDWNKLYKAKMEALATDTAVYLGDFYHYLCADHWSFNRRAGAHRWLGEWRHRG